MFGKKKIVVRTYVDDSALLTILNPVKTIGSVVTLGRKGRYRDAQRHFEDDAKDMVKHGYRVLSVNNGGSAVSGKDLTVTYELVEKAK